MLTSVKVPSQASDRCITQRVSSAMAPELNARPKYRNILTATITRNGRFSHINRSWTATLGRPARSTARCGALRVKYTVPSTAAKQSEPIVQPMTP